MWGGIGIVAYVLVAQLIGRRVRVWVAGVMYTLPIPIRTGLAAGGQACGGRGS